MILPTLKDICLVLENKGYKLKANSERPYNLNIVAIRSDEKTPNKFDDWLVFFFEFNDKWYFDGFPCTTDPGLFYLKTPMHNKGTAIIKEGQYLNSHHLGLHKGKYTALTQVSPVTVIRDFNRDNKLDFSSGREETGLFGINIHRAKLGSTEELNYRYHTISEGDTLYNISIRYGTTVSELQKLNKLKNNTIILGEQILVSQKTKGTTTLDVNSFSAGCIVVANSEDFNTLIKICQKSADIWGNIFTLTVINEKDFL